MDNMISPLRENLEYMSLLQKRLNDLQLENSFNMLVNRGQNAHREICECSAIYFYKTQNS